MKRPLPELLAPAGEYDSALAALHYGADAIYAGLARFSARAEAVNLSPDELEHIVTYAHSLAPRRRVYVTLNTLLRTDELPDLVRSLALCERVGVDAIIVQDLGVARLARRHFPGLHLHASTQLAIHNLEGARAAADLGFRRVTLARELTLDEIRAIAAELPAETEAFLHGALCYAYSGLCLYSALLRTRSGNRGACAYPCRDCFAPCPAADHDHHDDPTAPASAPPALSGLLFSMKDLALSRSLPDLLSAPLASLKIEGRKKSPLYVAAAVSYYRHLLDGTFTPAARAAAERDLRIIFSRPWTDLHLRARRNPACIDTAATGHRGVPLAPVLRSSRRFLQFRPSLPIEIHNGLQVELPSDHRPYGFPVDSITFPDGHTAVAAPANALIQVPLPPGAPPIPEGTLLHLASSQAVKRRYRFPRPNPAHLRARLPVDIVLATVPDAPDALRATATLPGRPDIPPATADIPPSAPPRDPAANHAHASEALSRLGDTPFALHDLRLPSPDALPFLPISVLNQVRRTLADTLSAALEKAQNDKISSVLSVISQESAPVSLPPPPHSGILLKTDQPDALLAALSAPGIDLSRIAEVILQLDPALPPDAAEPLLSFLPPAIPVRIALPPVMRAWDRPPLLAAIRHHLDHDRARWELSNLYALDLLPRATPSGTPLSLTADYPLYALNPSAALALLEDLTLTRLTFSPEDTLDNTRALAARFPYRFVWPIHRDPPLFISENCPYAAALRACPGPSACPAPLSGATLRSATGEPILLLTRRCRQYALLDAPQTHPLPPSLPALPRADFLLRPYAPSALRHLLFHLL